MLRPSPTRREKQQAETRPTSARTPNETCDSSSSERAASPRSCALKPHTAEQKLSKPDLNDQHAARAAVDRLWSAELTRCATGVAHINLPRPVAAQRVSAF